MWLIGNKICSFLMWSCINITSTLCPFRDDESEHSSVWVFKVIFHSLLGLKETRRSGRPDPQQDPSGGQSLCLLHSSAGERTLICWLRTLAALASGWRISGSFSRPPQCPSLCGKPQTLLHPDLQDQRSPKYTLNG